MCRNEVHRARTCHHRYTRFHQNVDFLRLTCCNFVAAQATISALRPDEPFLDSGPVFCFRVGLSNLR